MAPNFYALFSAIVDGFVVQNKIFRVEKLKFYYLSFDEQKSNYISHLPHYYPKSYSQLSPKLKQLNTNFFIFYTVSPRHPLSSPTFDTSWD